MGITTTLIMQLHMSFVLLIPYAGLVFLYSFRTMPFKKTFIYSLIYLTGILIGLSTAIPTYLYPDLAMKGAESNIVFNLNNFQNILTVLLRFLSFAGFEIPYVLGGGTEERLHVIASNIWMAPFAIILLLVGFLQIGLFILSFFLNKEQNEWQKIKWLTFFSWLLIFFSFFFSIKGPSSHTFYLMLPIPVLYSFYCYQWLVSKKPFVLEYMKIVLVFGICFHVGLGLYNYENKSLYVDRVKVQKAITEKDYTLLGERRAVDWGYGY